MRTYSVAKNPKARSNDKPPEDDPDIEDGEITDDDDDDDDADAVPPFPDQQQQQQQNHPEPNPASAGAQPTVPPTPKSNNLGNLSDSDSVGTSKDAPEPRSRDRSSDRERCSDEKDKISDGRERGDRRGRDASLRKGRGANRDDKAYRHMTEAERSILHLRKREKYLREQEKWTKQHRKDSDPLADDDFAKNIEKTLATILNKKEKELSAGEDVPIVRNEEEKKAKKRKREQRDKDHHRSKNKRKRLAESPRSEIDESEMLNIRSGSPGSEARLSLPPGIAYGPPPDHKRSRSGSRSEDSFNSEASSEERDERIRRRLNKARRKKEIRRERRERRGNRDDLPKAQDAQEVCVFYLQGKCQKNDCPYSHLASPPMKLELCKFYLMDCCAKGDTCSYMHSEFPCKFYHTGITCMAGKDCKFAHGRPLSEGLKQILFKHIETAPRDILQGFPRLSRDEALNLINQTQKRLAEQHDHNVSHAQQSGSELLGAVAASSSSSSSAASLSTGMGMYREDYGGSDNVKEKDESPKGGIPSLFDISVPVPRELDFDANKTKNDRSKPKNSRWQQEQENVASLKAFNYGTDQDMRFTSNGDVDMRTLPAAISNQHDSEMKELSQEVDFSKDIDIRQCPFSRNSTATDTDIRQFKKEESNFELPQTTKELLARISANQKDNPVERASIKAENEIKEETDNYDDQNINWYSDDDDDDDNRLMIKVEEEETHKRDSFDQNPSDRADEDKSADSSLLAPSDFSSKTSEIVDRLGDLSKIDISAEVTKLLTSMSQNKAVSDSGNVAPSKTDIREDPRISRQQSKQESRPQDPRLSDPRQRNRQNSTETKDKDRKQDKLSIYEQGGLDMKKAALEIDSEDLKVSPKSDIDLRNMALPFKGMQNYTPATEIDATISSHPPLSWKVIIVEIPRPDYTGLKLSISDAEKTGDPRLRKIFRLSVDEKDSPASPKASPKQSGVVRVDPRLKKLEEKETKENAQNPQMTYNQQVNILQSSQFYQSLTSSQKLMLNQELARCDQSGGAGLQDPVLNTLLASLNILPQSNQSHLMGLNPHGGAAASILNNLGKTNNLLSNVPMGQPGLLGAAPGIPNLPPGMQPNFPPNFDPRGGPGLLGNAPPTVGGFQQFGQPMDHSFNYNEDFYYEEPNKMGPQGNFPRSNRGFNSNNNRDGRRRGGNRDGFRGGRGNNRNFHKRGGGGGGRDKGDRDCRGRDRNRGHSPS